MKIEILGTGCPKCQKLHDAVKDAVSASGVTAEIVKVTKINDILKYGVMVTPALVIDGQVKVAGKVPSPDEIAQWLRR
ncbi:MAG: thioredoxin family protein [Candidatus Omnitrophota bacterium]|nr:thioredoxin family protein [Candidatus Omnitrophota bacterium]